MKDLLKAVGINKTNTNTSLGIFAHEITLWKNFGIFQLTLCLSVEKPWYNIATL